ncbi:MAG: DUF5706 domain-containing protein [Sphingobium sp.]|nr:DUF5706 domain-containing protein [Sphingobium sp.]
MTFFGKRIWREVGLIGTKTDNGMIDDQPIIGRNIMNNLNKPSEFIPNAIYVLRTTMQGNLTLSQMADQKANMIIGASFVIFTLSVGQIHAGTMLLPIAVLATGAFLAAICAIICVLPRVSKAKGALGPGDNLLFFGVYSQLSEENFSDEVLGRLQCDEDAYRMMLRDIYQNGQVLARKKYRFLGYAYRAFLTGLVGSFVLLVLELITGLRL